MRNNTLETSLNEKLKELTEIAREIENRKKQYPQGSLRIAKHNGHIYYYRYEKPDNTTGTYIKKDNMKDIKALAQKQYEEKFEKPLSEIIKQMKSLTGILSQNPLEKIYSSMKDERKVLVNPLEIDNEEYARIWQQTPYKGKSFSETEPDYLTIKGERVRSKTELIIADTLKSFNIPYRYEFPYRLQTNKYIYPDFTVLNKNSRQEYIIEHFGMMDNLNYAINAMEKIKLYTELGFYPGEKFLFTFETQANHFDTRYLSNLILHFLT